MGLFTTSSHTLRVIKQGLAARVIFFYPGEEGTYVDQIHATLYENGIVHLKSKNEETSTHLQNCEIIWHLNTEEERTQIAQSKVRLIKGRPEPELQ